MPRLFDPKALAFCQRFGRRIRRERKARGLTTREIADRLGFNETLIGRYERGDGNISLYQAYRMTQAVGCSFADVSDPPGIDLDAAYRSGMAKLTREERVALGLEEEEDADEP